jgi:subtilisin family serine protease
MSQMWCDRKGHASRSYGDRIVTAFLLCAAIFFSSTSYADDDRYIVRFKKEAAQDSLALAALTVSDLGYQQLSHLPHDNSVVMRMSRQDARAVAARANVERVEEDRRVWAFRQTNDPFLSVQYALQGTYSSRVTDAWDLSIGSSNALVAVIDTGADLNHEDLRSSIWTNPREIAGNGRDDDRNGVVDDIHGYDIANGDSDPQDDNGHGTHVSGIVAAGGDNALGVAGVAWGTQIIAVKALDSEGGGYTSSITRAIDYVTDLKKKRAPIVAINLSLGGGGYSGSLYRAVERARNHDILIVAAAGNDGDDNDAVDSYPANFKLDNVLSVAATDASGQLAGYSNFGANSVHVAAPGSDILSTYPRDLVDSGYQNLSGTSMASPHVAGIVALVAAANSGLSMTQVRSIILGTVQSLASLQGATLTGGITDARRAVEIALSTGGLPRLFGYVRDGSRGIQGAKVSVVSRNDPSVRRSVKTAKDGSYSISELQLGSYTVKVSKRGKRFRSSNVGLASSGVIRKNFSAR